MRRVELEIKDIAFGGKGVARENGKAVFVPFTIDGEKISAEIVHEKKKFAEAELVCVNEASPDRVQPECPYFGRCGGCSYQHIDYAHQLAIKWRQVRDVLQRIGKLADIPMRPIVPSPRPYGYRNRVTVHADDGVIGFFRRDSHRLIDVDRCPISRSEVNQALADLRAAKPHNGHYTLRANPNEPRIFAQANDDVAHALRDLVVQLVPAGQNLLIDVYCGAGFFAKALLPKFDQVIGVEWDWHAVREAQKTATPQETYIAGDADRVLWDLLTGAVEPSLQEKLKPAGPGSRRTTTVAVMADPPATGLGDAARRAILELSPDTLIYVSCNPSTLARDLALLQPSYKIESVTPLDMFPQTAEIEVAVHLQLRS